MTWTPAPPIDVLLSWPAKSAHPQLRGDEQYIITAIFGFIALICVGFRLYTRLFTRRFFGLDDYLIILASLSAIGVDVCITIGKAKYQWDRHLWDWNTSLSHDSLQILYVARILWGVATACVRLSILSLYYRLLKRMGARPRHFWVLHVMTGLTVMFLLDMIIGGAIPCLPVHAYWDYQSMLLAGETFTCVNDYRGMQVASVFNTVSEVVIAILPAIAVFRFKVDPRQRWGVIGLLSLGYIVAIAGIVRSYYLWKAAETYDLTWWAGPQWCAAEVEIDLALTAACAAPLRPPIARLIKRIRGIPIVVSSIGRRTPFSKDDRSILSTTALSRNDEDKFEGVAEIAPDDRNAWVQQMSRTIDLEGIAVDGFGYSVTIQGPGLTPRRRLSKFTKNPNRAFGSVKGAGGRYTTRDRDRGLQGDDRIELADSSSKRMRVKQSVEIKDDDMIAEERRSTGKQDLTRASSRQEGSQRVSEQSSQSMKNWTFLDPPRSHDPE